MPTLPLLLGDGYRYCKQPFLARSLISGNEKSQRVANYVYAMNHEIDMIAHSCGVQHARELHRRHARIVRTAGKSLPLDVLFPYPNDAPPPKQV